MDRFLKIFSRLLLTGLLLFEFLNYFRILNYNLDFTWLGLIITGLYIWLILETTSFFLKKFCGKSMSGWVMIIATIAIYVDALGDILHFYSQFGWWDRIAHLTGGGVAATGLIFYVVWNLCRCRKINIGLFGISFISLASATLLGSMYEIEEYLEDYFTGSHRLGDGLDTAEDLMFNIVGGLVVLSIIVIYLKIKEKRSNTALIKIKGNYK